MNRSLPKQKDNEVDSHKITATQVRQTIPDSFIDLFWTKGTTGIKHYPIRNVPLSSIDASDGREALKETQLHKKGSYVLTFSFLAPKLCNPS